MPANLSSVPAVERISLAALAKEQSVSPVTTWRWALRGVAGQKLPTVCVGSKRFTTATAFAEWCEKVTAARSGDPVPARSNKQREAAIDRAERQLAKMGV